MPDQHELDLLRDTFAYDHVSGIFTWKVSKRGCKAGTVAGRIKDGYRRLCLDGKTYQASSVAWYLSKGEWPKRYLWFQDGNRDNNAAFNLKYGQFDCSDQAQRNLYWRKYWRSHPDKDWERRIRFNYGIGIEEYNAMLTSQGGVCAICHEPETVVTRSGPQPLCVDHDHETGRIRGLLCRHCNNMLGHAKDRASTLMAAAVYLESSAADQSENNVVRLSGYRTAGRKG